MKRFAILMMASAIISTATKADNSSISNYEKNLICAQVIATNPGVLPGANPGAQQQDCETQGMFSVSPSGAYSVTVWASDGGVLSCNAVLNESEEGAKTEGVDLSNCQESYPKPRMGGSN
jgi:hypothetical protein